MSIIPGHNERSRQYDDYSHHETSFGGYNNFGTHVHVQEGTISLAYHNDHHMFDPSKPLDKLRAYSSPRATFDSGDRFDPPRCAESTRTEIIQRMEEWIDDGSNTSPASLFWLYGGAGAGKSALAQTLAERFHKEQNLAATFFFFRNDASRNGGNTLIPTLVSQMVSTFKGLGPSVEQKIVANPDLFTKQYQVQLQELLLGPLLQLKSKEALPLNPFLPDPRASANLTPGPMSEGSRPRLIVIDGLDECRYPEVQCILLQAIALAIPHIPYPLRFLVTSRPERHIVRVFDHAQALQAISVDRYNLSDDPDADMDIRRFLEIEFGEIRRSHCLSHYIPADWPDKNSINLLVERSSGHFIYASTVIRYIRPEQHRPDDRLEIILRLSTPQEQDRPYVQLDALYSLVFRGIENRDVLNKICLVLGILYINHHSGICDPGMYSKCSTIEAILEMRAGDLILILSPILSLVAIINEEVRILHKSLFDYLLDPTRCGHLLVPLDLARVHELVATYILKRRILVNSCTLTEFVHFAYHCRCGRLNDTLKDYLRKLEVPYPKCITVSFETLLDIPNDNDLVMIISHFLRALSRNDFDPTGRYHEQYAEKWISFLQSVVPGSDGPQTLPTMVDIHRVKDTLDEMLRRWKPHDFKSPGVRGTIPVGRLRVIDQEHRVWSTLSRATASITRSISVSSLVFGDDFIHSYHFATYGWPTSMQRSLFLLLRTYSTHENVGDENSVPYEMDVFKAMEICLRRTEGFLLSEFSRKYGIFPEGLLRAEKEETEARFPRIEPSKKHM